MIFWRVRDTGHPLGPTAVSPLARTCTTQIPTSTQWRGMYSGRDDSQFLIHCYLYSRNVLFYYFFKEMGIVPFSFSAPACEMMHFLCCVRPLVLYLLGHVSTATLFELPSALTSRCWREATQGVRTPPALP